MSNPANNPLFKHFRQPSIYLRLPSKGKFYSDAALDMPPIGEIPVYPMTVKDEITLKTPDALMNGQGMVDVVSSCCPNIKDPWQMPATDIDAVFIAIRLASFGPGMDITSNCPHCKADNEHRVNLQTLLDNVKQVDYTESKDLDGMKVNFRPQKYFDINQSNLINFEEQRLVQSVLTNESLSDAEKAAQFNVSFNKLKDMNVKSVAVCIDSIVTEDGTVVTDQAFIIEFLNNCSRGNYDIIKSTISTLVEKNKMDPITVQCDSCEKEYQNNLTFDQSNFFG
jgi:Zn finger protein HypA/HybF involved in hydrogenase expression